MEVVTPHLQVHHRKASVLPFRVCPPDFSSQEDRRQSTSITPLNVVEVEVPAWLPTSTLHRLYVMLAHDEEISTVELLLGSVYRWHDARNHLALSTSLLKQLRLAINMYK